MHTTAGKTFFLNFFFAYFPNLVDLYRRYEKISIKIAWAKSRLKFLQDCLEEKVLPRSMNWLRRLDVDLPFPEEAIHQLELNIRRIKGDLDYLYYRLRLSKGKLKSQVNDSDLWAQVQKNVKDVREYHRKLKESSLSNELDKLILKSPWSKFSRPDSVVNLSSCELNLSQKQILSYGLSFSLPHEKKHLLDYAEQLDKMKDQSSSAAYNFIFMNIESIYSNLKKNYSSFVPRRFHKALLDLKRNKSIRISKADKGGKVVVFDVATYKTKMFSLLNDQNVYQSVKSNPLVKMQSSFNKGLKDLYSKYEVEDVLKNFNSRLPSLPYAYGLPKIHKDGTPLRPIISTVNAPSYKLSKWLAKQLSPVLGSFSDSHLKHNQDLTNFLKHVVPGTSKLISFDVSALFTNVPLEPTLDFLKRKLHTLDISFDVPVDCLIDLIQLCLEDSFFEFDDLFYKQVFGIPMGSCLSPILAGFFLEHVESEMLPLYAGSQPLFWKRYVDDVLCLVSKNFNLQEYLKFINSLYPSLNLTYEWQKEDKIPFLDVLIHNCKSHLKFSVYRKPTHSESYLHYFSYCAVHIKEGVAKSLFLRALRVCDCEYLPREIKHINNCLSALAYPKRVLSKALSKAKQLHFRKQGKSADAEKPKNVAVVPFIPALKNIDRPLRPFNTKLIFSYKNKIGSRLSSNKPKKKSVGVYEVPCGSCPKLYTGETGRDLKTRLKEHQYGIICNDRENGIVNHTISEDHHFNFKEAKVVFPCTSYRRRHLVESALIKRYENMGLSANLNSGFSPHNELLSYYIREASNL